MLLSLIQNITGWRKQSSRTWEGPCPKCGGTKRCIAWIHQGIFKCRECDYKGDTITWLRDQEGMGCKQAFDYLGRECDNSSCLSFDKCRGIVTRQPNATASVVLPEQRHDMLTPAGGAVDPAGIWRDHADKLVAEAHTCLLENSEQLAYLDRRGLDLGAVVKYRLGWIPKDLYRPRAVWGLSDETKPDGKLKKLWIPQGIVIPWPSAGPVHRIRIRRPVVQSSETRYYWLPGSGNDTITFNNSKPASIIVESDLDALLLDYLTGDLVNVVSLGTCSARPKVVAADLLRLSGTILVALDSDQAGASNMNWWRNNYPQSERWPVVIGKDPGEMQQQGGDLRAWVLAGLPVSMHPADPRSSVPSLQPSTRALDVFITKTDRHGREYFVTDNRETYDRLRKEGRIVFSTKEMELCGQAMGLADDKQLLADCIMQVKHLFKGSFLKEVTACGQ